MGELNPQDGTDETRDAALLEVMLGGTEDVAEKARGLGMSPADIAGWASSLDTRRAVAGVRMLADVQAALALARLRVHAVNRLAKLALDDAVPVETGRKAAQALLAAGLDRVAGRMPEADDEGEDGVLTELATMRAALFGLPGDDAGPDEGPGGEDGPDDPWGGGPDDGGGGSDPSPTEPYARLRLILAALMRSLAWT